MARQKKMLDRRIEPEQLGFGKIFAVQAVLFFAIYGIMLFPRFSTDSYSVYFYTSNGLNGFLNLGRTGTYLLYKILLALGINSVTMSTVFTAVFCLTVAWSAATVLSLLKPYFPNLSWFTTLLLELAVVSAYGNIYFAELFFFSDVALMYAFTVFFMTLALILFFYRRKVIGTILSLISMSASLSFYQASLGLFMIFGFALVLVCHDVVWPQKGKQRVGLLARDLLRLLVVGGGASIANVMGMNLLGLMGFYTDRSPSLSLADIFSSVRQMFQQLNDYYSWGYPSYLTGILKIIFILAGPVLLFLLADSFDENSREHYPLASVLITLAMLVMGLVLVFAPHFLSKSVWIPPRSICSFFAVFFFMAVIIGYNYARNGEKISLAALVTMLIFVCANIVGIQCIALDQIKVNQMDRQQAEEIVRYIQEYEQESGLTIDTISWGRDARYGWAYTYPGVKYSFMDMNVRAAARSWSLPDCISYYLGRRLRSEAMSEEIWAAKFQRKGWDSFVPQEQLQFEGHTMYFVIY